MKNNALEVIKKEVNYLLPKSKRIKINYKYSRKGLYIITTEEGEISFCMTIGETFRYLEGMEEALKLTKKVKP